MSDKQPYVMAPIPLIHITPVLEAFRRIEEIQKFVANHYGVTVADVVSKKKPDEVNNARTVGIWLCMRLSDARINIVADSFKRNKHAVKRAVIIVNNKMETDKRFKAEVTAIYVRISSFFFPGDEIKLMG